MNTEELLDRCHEMRSSIDVEADVMLAKGGDEAARGRVMCAMLNVAAAMINRKMGPWWARDHREDFDDLLGDCAVHLVKAIDRHDQTRGSKFCTTAGFHIIGSIAGYRGRNSLIAVNPELARQARARRLGVAGDRHDYSGDAVDAAMAAIYGRRSMDASPGILASVERSSVSPEPMSDESSDSFTVIARSVAMDMGPVAMAILERRWLSDEPEFLRDIAKSAGVTRQRIAQVEDAMARELRRALLEEDLLPAIHVRQIMANPVLARKKERPVRRKRIGKRRSPIPSALVESVLKEVAICTRVSKAAIVGEGKYRDQVRARRVFCVVMRRLGYSITRIGDAIAKYHGTVSDCAKQGELDPSVVATADGVISRISKQALISKGLVEAPALAA